MIRIAWWLAVWSLVALNASAEVEVIRKDTPWRVWLVQGSTVTLGASNQVTTTDLLNRFHPQVPYTRENVQLGAVPENWEKRDFDDSLWGRYGDDLMEYIGGYGVPTGGMVGHKPARLCLRTRFGIADPARVTDLKLTVEFLGGAAVYVNGTEVGRAYLPDGPLEDLTLAKEYPLAAYTVPEGTEPLPVLGYDSKPEPKWLSGYQARVRTLTVTIPAKVLVKGDNVLAVELRRAPNNGPVGRDIWSHLAIRQVTLNSATGAGVIGYAEAGKGTRVWSAQPAETVTDRVSEKSLIARNWFKDANLRGMPLKGIAAGNPFDPVLPVRIHLPRNGVGHGQAVVTDRDGLSGLKATLPALTGPGGAKLPVTIRYGAQPPASHWCDDVVEQPPAKAGTVPVWLQVAAAKTQAPGWYTGTLAVEANGKQFSVPVQAFVSGFAVSDPRDFRLLIGVMHSPDTVAKQYGVRPYSPEHFKLMEKSLALAGQLGNDILYVPVIINKHMVHETGLIRWTKTAQGLKPDFSLFEKYVDLYLKYCAPPKAISFYVWSQESAKEIAQGYEGRQIMTMETNPKARLFVTQWDPPTGVTTNITAPTFTDEGAEAFWKPFLDEVQARVVKRGWSERVIMLGTGSDSRPSKKAGDLLRQWAPYARWDLYSHFSGDPGSFHYKGPRKGDLTVGKLIATGDLEIGMKEFPDCWGTALTLDRVQKQLQENLDYLHLSIHRLTYNEQSGPLVYRSIPCHKLAVARVGLDFWHGGGHGLIWGTYPTKLAMPHADGAAPSVRFLMMREGVQDFDARMALVEALPKLPADKQKEYTEVFNRLSGFTGTGISVVSQTELGLNWPKYVADLYRAAAEATGAKDAGTWSQPPQ